MSAHIALVVSLTFLIHLVGTLALGARIVGIRTGKWSVTYALFNIMTLVSRLATTLQAPLLAKTVEMDIQSGRLGNYGDFQWIMASATVATLVSILLFPSFQRLLAQAVDRYYEYRSIPRLLYHSLSWRYLRRVPVHMKWPDRANFQHVQGSRAVSRSIILLNVLSSAVLTVGVLATLYAGYLNPDLRSTSASMAGFINGISTILAVMFIDPDVALLTDEVTGGRVSEGYFRRYLVQVLAARLAGTVLAQALLVPFAYVVVWAAEQLRV
ncbi:DUF2837 family protein [Spirosoma taeanense]|uniref:Lipid II flippase Amj n=1 Tax=Spirosoma taeanense TaxID=2735870 RepID=A0A6M5YDY9_9BACT|nr:DUF2837 family protein [Spirosoma taeanense]QJW91511.1 DUF2837 family protein [Spirosoma taeanense]